MKRTWNKSLVLSVFCFCLNYDKEPRGCRMWKELDIFLCKLVGMIWLMSCRQLFWFLVVFCSHCLTSYDEQSRIVSIWIEFQAVVVKRLMLKRKRNCHLCISTHYRKDLLSPWYSFVLLTSQQSAFVSIKHGKTLKKKKKKKAKKENNHKFPFVFFFIQQKKK